MLIVVSAAEAVENEASLINSMFDAGLEVFHLRRPQGTAPAAAALLDAIGSGYRSRIALHQHHELAGEYGVCRLHYPEAHRRQMTEAGTAWDNSMVLSTSVHAAGEFRKLPSCFSYAFFGPVFGSISKAGYAALPPEEQLLGSEQRSTGLVALGGITEQNMQDALSRGFDGVALLGSVWMSADPLKAFKDAKKEFARCAATL